MAKTKKPRSIPPPANQTEQSERFLAAVQELVAAGELSPTDVEERFERLLTRATKTPPKRA